MWNAHQYQMNAIQMGQQHWAQMYIVHWWSRAHTVYMRTQDISLYGLIPVFSYTAPHLSHTQSISLHTVSKYDERIYNFCLFFSRPFVVVVDVVDKRNYLLMNWKSSLKSETVIVYNIIISIHRIVAQQSAHQVTYTHRSRSSSSMNVILIISWCCQFYNSHAQMFIKSNCRINSAHTHIYSHKFYCEFNSQSFFFHLFLSFSECYFFQLKSNENGPPEKRNSIETHDATAHNVINLNSMPENQKLIKYICSMCSLARLYCCWIYNLRNIYILFKSKNIHADKQHLVVRIYFHLKWLYIAYKTNCEIQSAYIEYRHTHIDRVCWTGKNLIV